MKAQLRLLPHWCQVIGYSYWLVYLAAILFMMLLFEVCPDSGLASSLTGLVSPFAGNYDLMAVINFSMIVLAAFSRERVEDEMIMSIRLKSIVKIVLLMFLLHIVAYVAPSGSSVETFAFRSINDVLSDFGVLGLLYLFIFKMSLLTNRWRFGHEE